jgi:hypothetical protein
MGRGLGWIDLHLVASTLASRATLATRDSSRGSPRPLGWRRDGLVADAGCAHGGTDIDPNTGVECARRRDARGPARPVDALVRRRHHIFWCPLPRRDWGATCVCYAAAAGLESRPWRTNSNLPY